LTDNGIKAVNAGEVVVLGYVGGDARYELVKGDNDRPAGWVSRQFDVKVPASTVIWRSVVHGNTTFTTEICCL
jgi:hypothetical protein